MNKKCNYMDDYQAVAVCPQRDQRSLSEIENHFESKVYNSTFGDLQ